MATSIIEKLLNYTPLDSSHNGAITIPLIKVKIIWGAHRADTFTYVSSGLYQKAISLTDYSLTGNPLAFATPRYSGGLPRTGIGTISTTSIQLLCDVNLNTVFVHFLVISSCS